MLDRDSFIFYRSFFEAIRELNADEQALTFCAICDLALNGKEAELTGTPKVVFTLMKPQILANNRRYLNGCKLKKNKQNGSKTEANDKQNGSKTEANDNVNDNVNENDIKTYAHQDARVSKNDSKNNDLKDSNLKNEFEKLWESYPNKKSKSKAMKSYIKARKRIKNPVTYEQVEKGIEAYTQYIQEKGLDMQYVKHGSTWFNNECWNDDYTIDPNKQNSLIKNNGWF